MTGYIIETILFMVAAIGALLLGFDLLSSNVTKLFHTQLKKLFNFINEFMARMENINIYKKFCNNN